MAWELYKKRTGVKRDPTPRAHIGITGSVSLNQAAKALLGIPFTFVTLYDRETMQIALRECRKTDEGARTVKCGAFSVIGTLHAMGAKLPSPGEVVEYEVSLTKMLDDSGLGDWNALVLKPVGVKKASNRGRHKTSNKTDVPAAKPLAVAVAPRPNVSLGTVEERTEALLTEMRNHCLLRSNPVTADVLDQWANRFDLPLVSVRELHRKIVDGQKPTGKVREAR